ncbi:gliding motility-associated C-terminal domain-containing protein [Roseivirga sp.]|uniref:T9SS type B sorting domain-containing protein n=1 Tax=Roseivirga sp. TaxID=1964215 RepID=UPI003B8E9609
MKRLILLIFLITGALNLNAQVTTEGKDFWLGFMQNFDPGAPSSLEIFLTSKERAEVEIFIYTDSRTLNITVEPGVTHREVIALQTDNRYAASGSGTIQARAIRVSSDVDISVYALNSRSRSADAAVVLPVNTLGNQYYVSAYWEEYPAGDTFNNNNNGEQDSPSSFLIVATADDTQLKITPSVDARGFNAGETFDLTLNQGDVYQVQADGDLTGTLIELSNDNTGDCKNFAVFGGNQWGRVTGGDDCQSGSDLGGFAADHLYEQMFPVTTWGENYIAAPYELRTAYVLQITAAEDDTRIVIGGDIVNLDAGMTERRLETDVVGIFADKPIQVAQFSQALSCDNNTSAGPGDPFMIMLSPNEQKLTQVTFNALTANVIDNYFVTVITESAEVNNITLNGTNIPAADFISVPGTGFSYANVDINIGEDYTLISEAGFIAYIYGFGNIESFGYAAGASLENLDLLILGEDPEISTIDTEACVNNEVDFRLDFEVPVGEDPRFDTFEWDFGDGSLVEMGQDVTHTYLAPGEYIIMVRASEGGACGSSETVLKTITVIDNFVDVINGPSSVCPDVTDIEYIVDGFVDQTYVWEIQGGTLTRTSDENRVLVDWGAARDDAFLKVVGINELGCETDTLTLDVIINKRLEPALPQSNGFTAGEVCFTDFNEVTYFTPQTNGSEYEWFIDGGVILTDNSLNEIRVRWPGPGTGRIWYREFNPLISDCEGFSDVLDVTIYTEIISTPTITNTLCNGDANGTISLTLSGGKPGNYSVAWSNGMSGQDIMGLAAGEYVATISDALGCIITETYTVTEPDVLAVADNQLIDVRCFQESNGSATIFLTGGTTFANGNYSYSWTGPNGFSASSNTGVINGLRAGNYSVDIVDANGCETSTTFVINEPALLEPDLETLINEPICPQASNGTAFIDAKGGTPDYQFFWSNNSSVDDPNASNLSKGNYTVRIVDANGCETSLSIEVEERFPRIFIPTAFSPNNDNTNDVFAPVTDCAIRFSMQIYNKWGAVIYSTEDVNSGWDGTFEGQDAPSGKYSYVIFYAGTLNDVAFEETYRGSLKLLR